jgi:hypothetical protein
MTSRPYFFLDVDGVLNATSGRSRGDWDDFREVTVLLPLDEHFSSVRTKFRIELSAKMTAEIAALDADIHWATTWENQANVYLREHTGFPVYPVACHLFNEANPLRTTWSWKWNDIKFTLENDPRPMIWADDEAIPDVAATWLENKGIPHLLIAPDHQVGLTRSDIEKMKAFLESVK